MKNSEQDTEGPARGIKDFSKLEKELDISFNDKGLLKKAFCHRSYLNENPDFGLNHNERLEFLGDAVLELAVTEYLYYNYPEKTEGDLTNWRAALVNSRMLAKIARKLNFNSWLLLSKGEQKETGKARTYILGDTFEAFLGALYLDKGFEACKDFIQKQLPPHITEIKEKGLLKDVKSKFQEEAQDKIGVTPTYQVLKEWGPDHDKHFLVGVFVEEEMVARGEGTSKQEAEERAAEQALVLKKWNNNN